MWVLIGMGAAVIGGVLFWAALQDWLADQIVQARDRFGVSAEFLQSALVTFDRVIVGGQRLIQATLHLSFRAKDTETPITVEEVRTVTPSELPVDVRQRVEAGQPQSYSLSVGAMQVQPNVTYKLAVRRLD
jgi:hypothetical protein